MHEKDTTVYMTSFKQTPFFSVQIQNNNSYKRSPELPVAEGDPRGVEGRVFQGEHERHESP